MQSSDNFLYSFPRSSTMLLAFFHCGNSTQYCIYICWEISSVYVETAWSCTARDTCLESPVLIKFLPSSTIELCFNSLMMSQLCEAGEFEMQNFWEGQRLRVARTLIWGFYLGSPSKWVFFLPNRKRMCTWLDRGSEHLSQTVCPLLATGTGRLVNSLRSSCWIAYKPWVLWEEGKFASFISRILRSVLIIGNR